MAMGTKFFEKLYTKEGSSMHTFTFDVGFPKIEQQYLDMLGGKVEHQEIKYVLFDMGPLKASGPDGLSPLFFKSQWETVGNSILPFVDKIFQMPSLVREVNDTLLVLIPKVDHPQSIKEFRPISLCNIIYEIVTKVVANRLSEVMPLVVAPNQCNFVKGCQSADNILLA